MKEPNKVTSFKAKATEEAHQITAIEHQATVATEKAKELLANAEAFTAIAERAIASLFSGVVFTLYKSGRGLMTFSQYSDLGETNMKSSGNLPVLRLTACFKAFVGTP